MNANYICFLIMPQPVAQSCVDNDFQPPTVEEIEAELSGEMRGLMEGGNGE